MNTTRGKAANTVMHKVRQKFLSDTLLYTSSKVLLKMRAFLVLPLFARMVGTEGYGVYSQLIVATALLVPFVSLSLNTAAVRFLSGEEDKELFGKKYYSALLVVACVGLAASATIILLAEVTSTIILGDPQHADLMTAAAILLLTGALWGYMLNYFRITHRMKIMTIVDVSKAALGTIAIFIAVLSGHEVAGAIWALVIVNLLYVFIFIVVIRRELGRIRFGWSQAKAMLKYSLPLTPNSGIRWTVNYADRIVILQVLGLASVGIYAVAYSLGSIIELMVMPIGVVMFPFISRAWDHGDRKEVGRYFKYVTRYYLLLAVPACIGLAILSQPIIRALASPQFVTDSLLVFWIAFGIVLNGLFQINVYSFHLARSTKYVTYILMLSAILNIALNLILVPSVGLMGSAVATAATFLLMATLSTIYSRKLVKYHFNWPILIKYFVAAAIMTGVLLLLPHDSIIEILFSILLGACVYLGAIFLLRTFSASELEQLRQLAKAILPGQIVPRAGTGS